MDSIKENDENASSFKNITRHKLNDMYTSQDEVKKGYSLDDKNSIKLCVFVCSSTGNGDMPENGEKFFRFLRRKTNLVPEGQKSTLMKHVYFTMLGLGSSDYSKY